MPCSVVPCDGGGCEALCASAAGLAHVIYAVGRSVFVSVVPLKVSFMKFRIGIVMVTYNLSYIYISLSRPFTCRKAPFLPSRCPQVHSGRPSSTHAHTSHLLVPHLKHCGLFTKFRSRPLRKAIDGYRRPRQVGHCQSRLRSSSSRAVCKLRGLLGIAALAPEASFSKLQRQ